MVRHDTEVVAFANLWQGGGEELSVDLMRYRPDSAQGVMDYLFIRIMLWGREQGFAWFNLGMAPLSGLQNRSLAPLWNRFGALVFGRGEAFYNFRGLHQYRTSSTPMGSALSGGTGRHDGVAEGAGGPDRADCPRLQNHRTITTTTQDQSCVPLSRMLYLIAVLLTSAARAGRRRETLDNPIFGKLAVYRTADEPKGVVLFASGAGGWNAELARWRGKSPIWITRSRASIRTSIWHGSIARRPLCRSIDGS